MISFLSPLISFLSPLQRKSEEEKIVVPKMKREHQDNRNPPPKLKMIEEELDAGVDELLAALGYKVRSSDMADVAQKLEQLDAVLSHLASDTVHYNPSDLSTWLESMLSELNTPPPPLPPPPQHPNPFDFTAAPASSIFDSPAESSTLYGSGPAGTIAAVGSVRDRKRMKTNSAAAAAGGSSSSSSSRVGSAATPQPLTPHPTNSEVSSLPPLSSSALAVDYGYLDALSSSLAQLFFLPLIFITSISFLITSLCISPPGLEPGFNLHRCLTTSTPDSDQAFLL